MADSKEWKFARCSKAHKEAWKHFYPEGNGKAKPGYLLHHIDEHLRENDFSRYAEWNVDDLVMIECGKHTSLHNGNGKSCRLGKKHAPESIEKMRESHKGQVPWNKGIPMTEDARRHLSEYWKGRCTGENHHFYGKHHTEEARLKIGEAHKGRHLYEDQRKNISEGVRRSLALRKAKEVANG